MCRKATKRTAYSRNKEKPSTHTTLRNAVRIKPPAVPLRALQFTKDVVSQLDGVRIDLRGTILLEAEGEQNLLDFSEAGLSEINYADYLEEVTHITLHNRCLLVCMWDVYGTVLLD